MLERVERRVEERGTMPSMNGRQKMIIALMDILLLAELTVAMRFGATWSGDMSEIFLRTYVPAAGVTIAVCLVLVRCLRTRNGALDGCGEEGA